MKKKSKLILYTILLTILTACGAKEISQADYEIIPLPQKTEIVEGGAFVLNNSTVIVFPKGNAELERIARFLSEFVQFYTGKTLTVSDTKKDENTILLESELKHENKEAYTLNITNAGITINGASGAGVFYGIQTLRKSICADAEGKDILFPAVSIEDYPRFGYRGMHLDVGRHFFPVEFIKEYIDIMALHNMNKFHWHLTEDQGWRIEIKKYPELTEKGSIRKQTVIGRNSGKYDGKPYGGFYTQAEAKEIVQYAQDRFITVIPEIDLPGHMLGALTAYPNLGCTGGPYEVIGEWGVFDDVLCAGNEDIYTFLDNILSEIIEIFPSEYIHIGGDECPKGRWKECPKCQTKIKKENLKADKNHSAEDRLQSYVISRVEKMLNDKGRKIIGWDEILEGGLAPNATVMSWRGIEGAIAAAKEGHDAIMTPNSHLYFDYYQTTDIENVPLSIGGYIPLQKVYGFEPVPSNLSENETKHIIGVQANLWTEYIPSTQQVEYMIMPRIDALSEVQWTMSDKKDYNSFLNRLFKMIKLYDRKGYNYSKSIFDINAKTKSNSDKGVIELSLSTIDDAPVYYTLDGTTPNQKSNKYVETLSFSESVNVKAIAIRPNIQTPVYSQEFHINKATMKPIQLNVEPHRSYTFSGVSALVDGIQGNNNGYKDGSWIGFYNNDIEALIDLRETTGISEVEVGTYICTGDWIFGAESLTISVSDDGENYKIISAEKYPLSDNHTEEVKKIKTSFLPVNGRYIKIKIGKTNKLPAWHSGAGSPAFMFIDEIRVN